MDRAKPFCIAKRDVWEAYKQVKANQGAAGVDGQSIEDFDRDLSKNLYRIWNRMCSGSYFPPPVRRVDIPKGDSGGTRPLGIPTASDRIAQMVVKRYLEPILDPEFHRDSYGYRPGRSAHDALAVARRRCWDYDWAGLSHMTVEGEGCRECRGWPLNVGFSVEALPWKSSSPALPRSLTLGRITPAMTCMNCC